PALSSSRRVRPSQAEAAWPRMWSMAGILAQGGEVSNVPWRPDSRQCLFRELSRDRGIAARHQHAASGASPGRRHPLRPLHHSEKLLQATTGFCPHRITSEVAGLSEKDLVLLQKVAWQTCNSRARGR